MAVLDETVKTPTRTMTLFFLVDASSSMQGEKIGSLNQAVRNVIPTIKEISEENNEAEIKIASLRFASGTEWMYDAPKLVDEFEWNDIVADGITQLGEAFEELNSKLSRKAYMNSPSGSFAPAIILLSDGQPTDDWEHGLEKLKENKWFKNGIKIAIAIGDDADKDVLTKFTGNLEAVFKAENTQQLKSIIRVVAVTSSKIGSQSSSSTDKTTQEKAIDEIKTNMPDDQADQVNIGGDSADNEGW